VAARCVRAALKKDLQVRLLSRAVETVGIELK
jgi:hypothetical protein